MKSRLENALTILFIGLGVVLIITPFIYLIFVLLIFLFHAIFIVTNMSLLHFLFAKNSYIYFLYGLTIGCVLLVVGLKRRKRSCTQNE